MIPSVVIARTLAAAVGTTVTIHDRTPLSGGDIHVVERVETSQGPYVVKSHPAAPPGMFMAEATGLRALRATGTPLRVSAVVAAGDDLLILEDLGRARRAPDFDAALGVGLAMLHTAAGPTFGFPLDTYCGTTRQPNTGETSWVRFYREARLGVQARQAARSGHLDASEAKALDRLIARIDQWIDEPSDGAVLVHGDLWSGNVHPCGDGSPALIDPAASFSHREAELGMMTLFGGFPARTWAAYEEARPLEPNWRERTPLYQLYHLLNHLNLFGWAYRDPVQQIIRRFA